MAANTLPTSFQQWIHISKYARFRDDLGRRETFEETIDRYITYFKKKISTGNRKVPWGELKQAMMHLEVMPSMRCLMTAGEALDIDNCAGYNCSYLTIDQPKAFDEIMYILMCFAPETMVKTRQGPVAISQLKIGDEVLSLDESTQFVFKPVTAVIETPSLDKPKLEIELVNGQVIKCTHDHKWLTTNRGWVEAKDLTIEDDLVSPTHVIYKITNSLNGKAYIGYTSKTADQRLIEHLHEAQDNVKYNSHFKRAIRKHGNHVWSVEVIDWVMNVLEAKTKEQQWIDILDTVKNGYNSTRGGDGANGYQWTDEQRTIASINTYERTEEHRIKQREVLVSSLDTIAEMRRTEEYREQQRQANLGSNNPQYGKRFITNGVDNKMIYPDKQQVPNGWRFGRTQPVMPRDAQGRFTT